jgi:hypothetical protein
VTVVETTAAQVRAQFDLAGARLIQMDERTLRVSLAEREEGRHYRNVDIAYNAGSDLYDVQVHTMDRETLGFETSYGDGLYFDQLGDLLAGRLHLD